MNKLSIQIVNYKTKKYLLDCLTSLSNDLKNFSSSYSIAILDNNSGENLNDLPGLFNDLKIELYQSEKNLGFGAGHNLLARKSNAEYLLILNPDIKFIEPDTITGLIETLDKNQAHVVGPRLLTAKGVTQTWDHGELSGFLAEIALKSGSSFWRNRKTLTQVAWVSGAVLLIKKNDFMDINGFDESFFLYKEEEDLCLRLRDKGKKIIYNPSITVLHYGEVVAKKHDHMQKSIDYFVSKHFKKNLGFYFFKYLNKLFN